MSPNRIMRGGAVGRALLCFVALLALAPTLAACGSGGEITTAVPDKEGDAEILNRILSRQRAVVDAYDRSIDADALHGHALAIAREFRAQEQEHIDAIVEALRGIGAAADLTAEVLAPTALQTEADHLAYFVELENATIQAELKAIAELTAPQPRSTLASIVANQAQHLVLLRRALGARPLETVPGAFENGTEPPP